MKTVSLAIPRQSATTPPVVWATNDMIALGRFLNSLSSSGDYEIVNAMMPTEADIVKAQNKVAAKKKPTVIPINIWDDYWDDETGKVQETNAYVEDYEGFTDEDKAKIMSYFFGVLATLDLGKAEFNQVGDRIEFVGLTHERRVKLVEELEKMKLSYNNLPLSIYSES